MKKWQVSGTEEIVTEDSQEFNYRKVLEKYAAYWRLFLIFLTGALVIAFLANRYTTPVYVVNASMLIKAEKEIANPVSDLLYGDEFFGRNSTNLDNESTLIKSYTLVQRTLLDLELGVSYFSEGDVRDRELYDESPIRVTMFPESTTNPFKFTFRCKFRNDSTYKVEFVDERTFMQKLLEKVSPPPPSKIQFDPKQSFVFGEKVDVNGFIFQIDFKPEVNRNEFRNKNFDQDVLFKVHNMRNLTKSTRSSLDVIAVFLEASVLKISMESTVPQKSIDFINRLINNYVNGELERKNYTASKTIEFIDTQIRFMSDSLALAEDRLETFKKENTAIDLSEEGTKLYSISQGLNQERSVVMVNVKYLDDLASYIQANNLNQIILPSSMGITDGTLNSLVGQLMSLQSEIVTMSANKNLDNPLIRLKRQEINGLKSSLIQNINSIKATSEFRLQELDRRLGGVNSSLRNLPTAERKLIDIQRNFNLSEELYLFLMEKRAEAGIAKASNTVDYRIIDEAQVEGVAPVKPSPILNYALAIFLGLSIPVILVYLGGLLNNKVTSKEQLLSLTTLPLLGVVAHNSHKTDNLLVTHTRPKSAISESFRSLRSNLRYLMNGTANGKVFMLTSSISGEGKSFCARNLGYIFSNFGKKVVVINADMRKHYTYEDFQIEAEHGLSDYLAGIVDVKDVLYTTAYKNLYVVPAGGIPPNPSELLISGRFDTILKELTQTFDYIILDTPPIGILADGIELMKSAHTNLFVVRQGYTFIEHVKEANEIYRANNIHNCAIIYNDVKLKKHKYGYGYYDEDYVPKKKIGKPSLKSLKI